MGLMGHMRLGSHRSLGRRIIILGGLVVFVGLAVGLDVLRARAEDDGGDAASLDRIGLIGQKREQRGDGLALGAGEVGGELKFGWCHARPPC